MNIFWILVLTFFPNINIFLEEIFVTWGDFGVWWVDWPDLSGWSCFFSSVDNPSQVCWSGWERWWWWGSTWCSYLFFFSSVLRLLQWIYSYYWWTARISEVSSCCTKCCNIIHEQSVLQIFNQNKHTERWQFVKFYVIPQQYIIWGPINEQYTYRQFYTFTFFGDSYQSLCAAV